MTGIELIAQERAEHASKHGKDLQYDLSKNQNNELTGMASILLPPWSGDEMEEMLDEAPQYADKTLLKKMLNKTYRDRLIISGSLIAAEIDRIDAENARIAAEVNDTTHPV